MHAVSLTPFEAAPARRSVFARIGVFLISGIGVLALAVLVAAPSLAAGNGKAQKRKHQPPPFSGFLGDYSGLGEFKGDDSALIYRRTDDVLADYDRFIVEPVLMYLAPDSLGQAIDPAELAMLADAMRDAMIGVLHDPPQLAVVDEAGPRTLTLRVAITRVEAVKVKKNIGSSLVGTAVGAAVPGAGFLVPRADLGEAWIEAELVDSLTGERQAAMVDSESGQKYFSGLKGYKRWGDVKAAFHYWAKELRAEIKRERKIRRQSAPRR
jgi:hypothetical protein